MHRAERILRSGDFGKFISESITRAKPKDLPNNLVAYNPRTKLFINQPAIQNTGGCRRGRDFDLVPRQKEKLTTQGFSGAIPMVFEHSGPGTHKSSKAQAAFYLSRFRFLCTCLNVMLNVNVCVCNM